MPFSKRGCACREGLCLMAQNNSPMSVSSKKLPKNKALTPMEDILTKVASYKMALSCLKVVARVKLTTAIRLARSMTRSATTVPREVLVGMPVVLLKTLQRTISPSRGANRLLIYPTIRAMNVFKRLGLNPNVCNNNCQR